jgi:hypothetical protein
MERIVSQKSAAQEISALVFKDPNQSDIQFPFRLNDEQKYARFIRTYDGLTLLINSYHHKVYPEDDPVEFDGAIKILESDEVVTLWGTWNEQGGVNLAYESAENRPLGPEEYLKWQPVIEAAIRAAKDE